MSLIERIDSDLKNGIKSGDKTVVSTLRLVKSAIKNKEIAKGEVLSDDEVVSVLSTLSKQRRESIEQFAKGGREDLVSTEKAELDVLQKYLPKQLSEEELEEIIRVVVKETGAVGQKDVGMVMKAVMSKVRGRADGKSVNKKVVQHLSS